MRSRADDAIFHGKGRSMSFRNFRSIKYFRRRAGISLVPILIILVSSTFASVKSSQAFVSACEKTTQYSSSQVPFQSTLGSVYSGDQYRYTLAGTSPLTATRAKARRPRGFASGGDTKNSLSSAIPHPRQQFIDRYTSLESLRETFGTNKNRIWGDLDAASARRLYKTLLPKALLELVQAGVQPEELAPLAYSCRKAAKLYARERCTLPARLLANLFDGIRSLKRYGRWQPVGMSYEQVWDKYQKVVMEDWEEDDAGQTLSDEDIAIRSICMRILEASTRTNDVVDKWTLPEKEGTEREELAKIAQTLEKDVRKLLQPVSSSKQIPSHVRRYKLMSGWLTKLLSQIKELKSKVRGS